MKLYELTGEYAALQRLAEDGEDVTERLATLEGQLEAKAESISAILAGLDADAEALKAEEDRLAARRKALENNRDRLREYVKANMVGRGIERIKTPVFTWSVGDGPERVAVVDEALIPDEYFRIKREVARSEILKAYKESGECVPGTAIERSKVLRIR